jgi:hypothetical protein
MAKNLDMTVKKQKQKAEAKPSRSRSLAPRSEHPAKRVMRELLEARQEDRAFMRSMADQIATLTAIVKAGQAPVLPTAIDDYTKMLNCRQFCEVLGGVDENRFYNRTDTKTIGGTKLVDGDAVRLDYPDRFNESLYQKIRAKAAELRKPKAIPEKTGIEFSDKAAISG